MSMNVEDSVRERYSEGARERQEALCCPVDYDDGLLAMLPDEIIEKDYGCGDPTRYVKSGEVVLDLGSGAGKICYMAAQLVGEAGHVIGIDMNDDMLGLARRYQPVMAKRLGSERVTFRKGNIQDLGLDHEKLDAYLSTCPVSSVQGHAELRAWEAEQRRLEPMVTDASIDLVISNCVLNLVADEEKQQLVSEIYRVLKPGGRIAISDIVSDSEIPDDLKQDPSLWSGCISGAFHEAEFLDAFAQAGFHGVMYDKWEPDPWQTINGIVFRSVTLVAVKPVNSDSGNTGGDLLYRGPFAEVIDDAGNRFVRGQRVTVGAGTRRLATGGAFGEAFIDLETAGSAAEGCCTQAGKPRGNGCC